MGSQQFDDWFDSQLSEIEQEDSSEEAWAAEVARRQREEDDRLFADPRYVAWLEQQWGWHEEMAA